MTSTYISMRESTCRKTNPKLHYTYILYMKSIYHGNE